MIKYDTEYLYDINKRADLTAYISHSHELERRGKRFFIHCPKHIDKTPSLCIDSENNFYHCFSCGRSGGLIQWLRDFEGMPFDDAIKKAASIAGVDLSRMCVSDTVMFLKSVSSNLDREHLEHPILSENEYWKYKQAVIDEWVNEGISQDTLNEFDIRLDSVSQRIVYPVRDASGRLINIKGRTRLLNYKEIGIAKYINYFPVGQLDYLQGLYKTDGYIREAGEMILFESFKSVLKCWGWGIRNTASAECHMLSQEQMELIISLGVNVTVAFDRDVNVYRDDKLLKRLKSIARFADVYIITDRQKLLSDKDSPADRGKDIFLQLYNDRRKLA